jgi:tRNA(Ile)-lysidine synthase
MNALNPLPAKAAQPLSDDEFAALMEACRPWGDKPRVAVAVSGGPDSTALALLLHTWAKARHGEVIGLTIDHRLREGSGDEAKATAQFLSSHGLTHGILHWEHETPPQSAIHASARKARYELLLANCRREKIPYLFLAHHADDQAETILMRLSRSTGIDGLAGMAARREQDGVQLIRPLLPVRKSRLEATCVARGWNFVRDPSNHWERFTRTRLRGMQQALSKAGLTTDRLSEIAREAGAARAYLESACNEWLQANASLNIYGVVSLAYEAWQELAYAMRLRVLSRALMAVGGSEYPPRGASLERLAAHLMRGQPRHHTLSGCHIEMREDTLFFTREEGTADEAVELRHLTAFRRWDNRFIFFIDPNLDREGLTVRRLGQISRNMLMKKDAERVAALPACMRGGLPGIFRDSVLVWVPEITGNPVSSTGQAVVTAVFSPRHGFLVKPFCPSSLILTN